ncbi:DUF2635 domain-containing protein [Vibrio atlanticus]|uniref:DUF2635 domain-containing protein n=1 Tax=Vibrio atlanticus TaxID=693153 RepID=UPI003D0D0314
MDKQVDKPKVPTFKIKPATKDLIVKDPITREPLKATGEEKPRNAYWLRRLAEESVVDIDKTAKPTAKKETK